MTPEQARKLLPALEALYAVVVEKLPGETWGDIQMEKDAREAIEAIRDHANGIGDEWRGE